MRMPIDIPLGSHKEVGAKATKVEFDAEGKCFIFSYPNTPDGRETTLRVPLTEKAMAGFLSMA